MDYDDKVDEASQMKHIDDEDEVKDVEVDYMDEEEAEEMTVGQLV